LRTFGTAKVLGKAFARGCDKGVFRICQFSVQGNHVHLICEARDAIALARGIQGWKIRVARGLNRRWGRAGRLYEDRYHVEILTCPSQVKNTLVYVLQNGLKHGQASYNGIDLFSSAWHFDEHEVAGRARTNGSRASPWAGCVVPPRTKLLKIAGAKIVREGDVLSQSSIRALWRIG
jgi:REP element-mobilizing transposase RayT